MHNDLRGRLKRNTTAEAVRILGRESIIPCGGLGVFFFPRELSTGIRCSLPSGGECVCSYLLCWLICHWLQYWF